MPGDHSHSGWFMSFVVPILPKQAHPRNCPLWDPKAGIVV
jgi:hypothetical protein